MSADDAESAVAAKPAAATAKPATAKSTFSKPSATAKPAAAKSASSAAKSAEGSWLDDVDKLLRGAGKLRSDRPILTRRHAREANPRCRTRRTVLLTSRARLSA